MFKKKIMKNKNTKAVAAGVGLLALCQGGYIYKQSGNIDKITEQMEVASTERGKILSELERNKLQSDSLIGRNSALTKAIVEDEKKITILNAELRAAKLKFEKLQQSYNLLKAKSEAMASNLNSSSNALKKENSIAIANEKARQKALRVAKDSMERERLVALAAKKAEAEKSRLAMLAAKKEAEARAKLEALAAQKDAAERLKAANELAEKSRLEALAAKKLEIARVAAEKQVAEKARLEMLEAKKNDITKTNAQKQAAEKARLEILSAKKLEAERDANERLANEKAKVAAALESKKEADRMAAEKAKADLLVAKRIEAERLAAEKAKTDEMAAKRIEAERAKLALINVQKNDAEKAVNKELQEKNRIEALIEKKRAEVAKARQAIADRNKADEDAIKKSQILPTNTATAAPNKFVEEVVNRPKSAKSVSNQDFEVNQKLTKIKVTGFNTSSYRYVNEETKEEEETDDSSEVGFFKVNFTIPQNFVVRASDRNYYIQVVDQNGKYVGETASEIVDGEKLVYNQRANVKYKNRAVKISEYVFLKGLKEGTYTVKLFDKNELVSKALIVLN